MMPFVDARIEGLFQSYREAALAWYRAQFAAFADPTVGRLDAADAAWRRVVVTRDAWRNAGL
jgi:hypothetical protein